MAFSSSVTGTSVFGNMRVVWGSFTNGATDEGGDITTGLSYIHNAIVNVTSHVGAAAPKLFVNSTNAGTTTNGTLGLLAQENVDGTWMVFGN